MLLSPVAVQRAITESELGSAPASLDSVVVIKSDPHLVRWKCFPLENFSSEAEERREAEKRSSGGAEERRRDIVGVPSLLRSGALLFLQG